MEFVLNLKENLIKKILDKYNNRIVYIYDEKTKKFFSENKGYCTSIDEAKEYIFDKDFISKFNNKNLKIIFKSIFSQTEEKSKVFSDYDVYNSPRIKLDEYRRNNPKNI